MAFILPPKLVTEKGNVRRVGIEIEFGGVGLPEVAQIIANLFGGQVEQTGAFSYKVKNTPYGEYSVESDARFLSEKRYEKYLEKVGVEPNSDVAHKVEKVLEKFAGSVLPFEIATPPIPMDDLGSAEKIRQELFRHSARGTRSNPFAAFGMQFNPELPDFEASTILNYLRAFLLLFDWLHKESEIVFAREVAPFITPFPIEYSNLILNAGYNPNIDQLITDYLEINPTRNRPLDMLPLFTYLNKELVFSYPVEKDLIKPRPTFHYRLPNSEVDDPTWSLAHEWNKWVEVEKLANHPERINTMAADYFQSRDSHVLFPKSFWIEKTKIWLAEKF
jgi:hypothetical protein